MPSQPDFEAAYSKNPELRPKGDSERLKEERAQKLKLAERLAASEGKSVDDVLKELEQSTLSVKESPIPEQKPDVNEGTVAAVTQEEAQFFASKEGSKYFPIADLDKKKLKPENIIFFRTAEEAEAASFTA